MIMARQLSSGPYSITTAPTLTTCGRCRRPMLAATVGGFDRRIDTATLNDEGELAALIAGRTTYELHGEYLIRRTKYQLALPRPANYPVLADHECRVPLVAHIDQTHTFKAMALVGTLMGATLVSDTGGPPPF